MGDVRVALADAAGDVGTALTAIELAPDEERERQCRGVIALNNRSSAFLREPRIRRRWGSRYQ
jgi:hypothetical protein